MISRVLIFGLIALVCTAIVASSFAQGPATSPDIFSKLKQYHPGLYRQSLIRVDLKDQSPGPPIDDSSLRPNTGVTPNRIWQSRVLYDRGLSPEQNPRLKPWYQIQEKSPTEEEPTSKSISVTTSVEQPAPQERQSDGLSFVEKEEEPIDDLGLRFAPLRAKDLTNVVNARIDQEPIDELGPIITPERAMELVEEHLIERGFGPGEISISDSVAEGIVDSGNSVPRSRWTILYVLEDSSDYTFVTVYVRADGKILTVMPFHRSLPNYEMPAPWYVAK
jgi:hypothetical protein